MTPAIAQSPQADAAPASVVLDPLSVEGSYTAAPTYQVKDLYSGTKTITPRLSLPQQVDVVPQEVLRDTAATRVERALDYVSGVNKQNDFGARNLALYSVRGFATQDIFLNGFNIARGYNGAPDTQNVQTITLLSSRINTVKAWLSPSLGMAKRAISGRVCIANTRAASKSSHSCPSSSRTKLRSWVSKK